MDDSENVMTIPGDRLGSTSSFKAGSGTYIKNGFIYSKLCGKKTIQTTGDQAVLEVSRNKLENVVPDVNSIALSKVVSNNPRFCKVLILSVNGISLKGTFKGIIRREDVRATEKDKVVMYESFRPGDIVLTRVLSLGDSQSYYLCTAENELGVIYALSESGQPMIPVSWCEMQCTKTGLKERRKVAKVKVKEI